MFKKFFKEQVAPEPKPEIIQEKVKLDKPESILRDAGYKIKLMTPTSFGTQIDLFIVPQEDEIKELHKNFDIKVKGKSIFVII